MSDAPAPGGGWLASLGKGTKWFAGIVIVALVGAVVPVIVQKLTPEAASVNLDAKFSRVTIDREVRLGDFKSRYGIRLASAAEAQSGMTLIAAYADVLEQPGDQTRTGSAPAPAPPPAAPGSPTTQARTTGGETSTTGTPTQTTGTPTQTTGTQTSTTGTQTSTTGTPTSTTGTQTSTGEAQTTTSGEPLDPSTNAIVEPQLDAAGQAALSQGVALALAAPGVDVALTSDCVQDASDDGCGLTSMGDFIGVAPDDDGVVASVSSETVGRRLASVFRTARTVPPRSGSGRREMVGVTVNFKVTLIGFRAGTAEVRWALLSKRSSDVIPLAWGREQRALQLRGSPSETSAVSKSFWVPLPRRTGRYFIRMTVYGQDGLQRDYVDTHTFG